MKKVWLTSPGDLPRRFEELVRLFPPRAIRDEKAYLEVRRVIDTLTSVPRLTRGQAEYLDTLTVLFEAYERDRFPVDVSGLSGADVLTLLLEEHGMSASDLGRLLGDRSLGSKILRRERSLSKAHIRKLSRRFRVAAEVFLDPVASGVHDPR